jgi:TonB family protein
MMKPIAPFVAALLLLPFAAPAVRALDEPLTAGSGGVPVPKRTKTVTPEYPAAAQSQGIRGIVILQLVIDPEGKVTQASVVRSVPGLDEAALAAARQWTYESVKVDGKPVSVRLTVPITFAMKLPDMSRQEGIPELRQGATPSFPPGARGPATAAAEVTLDPEGRVGEARITGGEAPWTDAIMAALRTWRFATDGGDATVSFRVQADFIPGEKKEAAKVNLRLDGLRRSEALASTGSGGAPAPPEASSGTPAAAMPAPNAAAPATATPATTTPPVTAARASTPAPATPPGGTTAAPATSAPATPPAAKAGAPVTAGPAASGGSVPGASTSGPATAAPAGSPAAKTAPGAKPPAASSTAAPPVEVVSAPPPPPELESGTSAIRDVTLETGVPDLTKGRRPVVPPFARMSAVGGTVEVQFSVGASGNTLVQSAKGPDLLKTSAEQTVTSWQFHRTRADRILLTAVFNFDGDRAAVNVRPQAPPPAPPPQP